MKTTLAFREVLLEKNNVKSCRKSGYTVWELKAARDLAKHIPGADEERRAG